MVLFVMLCSCEEETHDIVDVDYETAMQNLEFSCEEISRPIFLEGLLDGDSLCYSSGVNGYTSMSFVFSSIREVGSVISVGDFDSSAESWTNFDFGFYQSNGKVSFQEEFVIISPREEVETSLTNMVEKHLSEGDLSLKSSTEDGFEIKFVIPYSPLEDGNFILYEKSTAFGDQSGSSFLIEDLEIINALNQTIYIVRAHINCKLYNPFDDITNGELFAELKDLQLSISINVKK